MSRFNDTIKSSEITPESVYASRRSFLKLGICAFGAAGLAACGNTQVVTTAPAAPSTTNPAEKPVAAPSTAPTPDSEITVPTPDSAKTAPAETSAASAPRDQDELGSALTSFDQITSYNNYYEFSSEKEAVAGLAQNFQSAPWTVEVGGLVNAPKTFDIDDLRKRFPQEERVYRLRCVEGWSMVIPWTGFTLASLLRAVEPKSDARFVRFISLNDAKQFPGQNDIFSFQWPYSEALRLDEAMNDLTLLATGLYGKPLPNQNGAPIRLAVPWKYGFKSAKAIVKIELVAEQPTTFWTQANAAEYGFYANVNPAVAHPRWTQSTERRIGESGRRKSLPFNGYAAQVAAMYDGMDLAVNY